VCHRAADGGSAAAALNVRVNLTSIREAATSTVCSAEVERLEASAVGAGVTKRKRRLRISAERQTVTWIVKSHRRLYRGSSSRSLT
jgi:hypothetical protein